MTEVEVVGWHHWLNGHEFEQTLGDTEGQGSLACCSPWGCKQSDMDIATKNNNTNVGPTLLSRKVDVQKKLLQCLRADCPPCPKQRGKNAEDRRECSVQSGGSIWAAPKEWTRFWYLVGTGQRSSGAKREAGPKARDREIQDLAPEQQGELLVTGDMALEAPWTERRMENSPWRSQP